MNERKETAKRCRQGTAPRKTSQSIHVYDEYEVKVFWLRRESSLPHTLNGQEAGSDHNGDGLDPALTFSDIL